VRTEITPSKDVLHRTGAAGKDLCPCGAPPRAGSIYCSDDCVPTYHGADTISDVDGTGMRWRPDLAADEREPAAPWQCRLPRRPGT
jgi:hypothetical protein